MQCLSESSSSVANSIAAEGESPAPSSPSFLRGWAFPFLLRFREIMINYALSSSFLEDIRWKKCLMSSEMEMS